MVDLETTGTDRSHSAIIQIAAAFFDPVNPRIGPTFDMCLDIPYGRFWDESTRGWWASKPDVYKRISAKQMDPGYVTREFVQWVRSNAGVGEQVRMWAKPSSFDYPILESYFNQFNTGNPFHFREVIDMQSFIRGMRHDHTAPPFDKEVPMIGDAHYALDDVFHQIQVVIAARQRFIHGEKHD